MASAAVNEHAILSRACALALLCLATLVALGQVVDEDRLRKLVLEGSTAQIIDLEALPDGHTVLASCAKGAPLLLIDTAGWRITRTFPVDGFIDGAHLKLSADGRHAVLLEEPRAGADPNADPGTRAAVLDLATGALVLDVPKARDAELTPDATRLITLGDGVVQVRSLTGEGMREIPLPMAARSIAIAPDGLTFAVSHRPTPAELEAVPSLRTDKKAVKPALKYRQLVSFHALADGRRIRTVPEIYDVVKALRFTRDGAHLLVYSVPDTRWQPGTGNGGVMRIGRVEQVDAASGTPLRAACMSRMNGPRLAVSPDGATLALSSTEGRNKRQLVLFDLATGDTRLMIDLAQRRRNDKEEGETHDGRLGYGWLSDGRLLVAQGNDLGCYAP